MGIPNANVISRGILGGSDVEVALSP